MKYQATRDTLIKTAPIQSKYLSEHGIRHVKKGEILEIDKTDGVHGKLLESIWHDTPSYVFMAHFENTTPQDQLAVIAAATQWVSKYEGFSNHAYLCPAGYWTVGYGSRYFKGVEVVKGLTITREEASTELAERLESLYVKLRKNHPEFTQLNTNQKTAILSFCDNVGYNAFLNSTFRKHLISGFLHTASTELLRWDKDGKGNPIPGLTRRRKEEFNLFNR